MLIKKSTLSTAALWLVTALLFTACSKQEVEIADQREKDVPAVRMEAGKNYLSFSNRAAFEQTLKDLQGKRNADLDAWEAQWGFTSMRKVYNLVIAAEIAKNEAFDQLPESEKPANARMLAGLTPLGKSHLKMLRIDQEGLVDMNIFNDDLAKLVNEEGVVKIGQLLYQYSYDKIRIITNGDESKLPSLKNHSRSAPGAHVFVSDVVISRKNISNARYSYTNSCDARTGNSNNSKRVIGYEANIYSTEPATTASGALTGTGEFITRSVYEIKVRSLRRNWIGSWVDQNATLRAYGDYNASLESYASRSYDQTSNNGGSTFVVYLYSMSNFAGYYSNGYPIVQPYSPPVVDISYSYHTVVGAEYVTCSMGEY